MSETSHYEDVNERLKQIVEEVSDETLPLDEALDLFEEAVKLGMEASTMMEEDMAERDAQAEADEAAADAAFEAEAEEADGAATDTPAADVAADTDASADANAAFEANRNAEAEVDQGASGMQNSNTEATDEAGGASSDAPFLDAPDSQDSEFVEEIAAEEVGKTYEATEEVAETTVVIEDDDTELTDGVS